MKILGMLRPADLFGNGWVWEWVVQCPSTSLVEIPDYLMPLPELPKEDEK